MRHAVLWFVSGLTLGCDAARSTEAIACTLELRVAVDVNISSPQGLPVVDVKATNHHERACLGLGGLDTDADTSDAAPATNGSVGYACMEDGGGTYVVRVKSDRFSWTQQVNVKADACHTTEVKTLTFVLDPQTVD